MFLANLRPTVAASEPRTPASRIFGSGRNKETPGKESLMGKFLQDARLHVLNKKQVRGRKLLYTTHGGDEVNEIDPNQSFFLPKKFYGDAVVTPSSFKAAAAGVRNNNGDESFEGLANALDMTPIKEILDDPSMSDVPSPCLKFFDTAQVRPRKSDKQQQVTITSKPRSNIFLSDKVAERPFRSSEPFWEPKQLRKLLFVFFFF